MEHGGNQASIRRTLVALAALVLVVAATSCRPVDLGALVTPGVKVPTIRSGAPMTDDQRSAIVTITGWVYRPGATVTATLNVKTGVKASGTSISSYSCLFDHERPDVEALYPQIPPGSTIGFTCYFHVPNELRDVGLTCGPEPACARTSSLTSDAAVYVVPSDGEIEFLRPLDRACTTTSTCSYVPA